MKFIKYILLSILLLSNLSASTNEYKNSNKNPIHEKFNFISDTELGTCDTINMSTPCSFNITSDSHLILIFFLSILTMYIIVYLIGWNADGQKVASLGGSYFFMRFPVSKKYLDKINSRPFQIGKAIIVFVIFLYIISYISSNEYNKTFNFNDKKIYLTQDKDIKRVIEFNNIEKLEILKYKEDKYIHYEFNLELLGGERIHLYTDKSDTFINIYAQKIGLKINKPIKYIISK